MNKQAMWLNIGAIPFVAIVTMQMQAWPFLVAGVAGLTLVAFDLWRAQNVVRVEPSKKARVAAFLCVPAGVVLSRLGASALGVLALAVLPVGALWLIWDIRKHGLTLPAHGRRKAPLCDGTPDGASV